MKQNKIFLSLGSNIGEMEEILKDSVLKLGEKITNIVCSSIYKTKPLYYNEQPDFYNLVVSGNTLLSYEELFKFTGEIEHFFGRNRDKEIRNGPRSLDIDILLFNNICINTKKLIIPHPGIEERLFVLVPLNEIDNTLTSPRTGKLFSSYIDKLSDQEVIKIGFLPKS